MICYTVFQNIPSGEEGFLISQQSCVQTSDSGMILGEHECVGARVSICCCILQRFNLGLLYKRSNIILVIVLCMKNYCVTIQNDSKLNLRRSVV